MIAPNAKPETVFWAITTIGTVALLAVFVLAQTAHRALKPLPAVHQDNSELLKPTPNLNIK
jgi:hypothetical protein